MVLAGIILPSHGGGRNSSGRRRASPLEKTRKEKLNGIFRGSVGGGSGLYQQEKMGTCFEHWVVSSNLPSRGTQEIDTGLQLEYKSKDSWDFSASGRERVGGKKG